jgi:hypothetical protein
MNSLTTPSYNHSSTEQDKEEEETNNGTYGEDVWEVIRLDLKKRGTELRWVFYWPCLPLLMNRFCQYHLRNVTTGTTKMIMYDQTARRSPGINQAIEEYWIERKRLGKITPLQQMALDDGFF